MAKGAGSDFGTGGMVTKIDAARIATDAGCDMIIANGKDFRSIHGIVYGESIGTLFLAHKNEDFDLKDVYKRQMENQSNQKPSGKKLMSIRYEKK